MPASFPRSPGLWRSGLHLWAAAHGLAALLINKPWFPWGEVDEALERALRVSVAGCSLADRLADVPLDELGQRLAALGREVAPAPR